MIDDGADDDGAGYYAKGAGLHELEPDSSFLIHVISCPCGWEVRRRSKPAAQYIKRRHNELATCGVSNADIENVMLSAEEWHDYVYRYHADEGVGLA